MHGFATTVEGLITIYCASIIAFLPFSFHQIGARLRRETKLKEIPRENQHEQVRKTHLDYSGVTLPG